MLQYCFFDRLRSVWFKLAENVPVQEMGWNSEPTGLICARLLGLKSCSSHRIKYFEIYTFTCKNRAIIQYLLRPQVVSNFSPHVTCPASLARVLVFCPFFFLPPKFEASWSKFCFLYSTQAATVRILSTFLFYGGR